jgi:hypothetical protein
MDERSVFEPTGPPERRGLRTARRAALRRTPLLFVLSVALGILAAPAQASNLTVDGLTFQSTPSQSHSARFPSVVIESDKKGPFGLVFTIKNTGKVKARNINARVFVSGKEFRTELVGSIGVGHAKTVHLSYNPSFVGPGLFDVSVCVGRHNCTRHVKFSVIPRRWNVKTFTDGPSSLVGIPPFWTTKSVGMTFDFFGTVQENGDYYFAWLATGGVTEDVSGNDGVCTYSGHGAVSHSPWDLMAPELGYLEISPGLDSYFAEVQDDNHGFTVTQNCPGALGGQGYTSHSVFSVSALQTLGSDGRVDQPTSPDARTLKGSYTIPTGLGHGTDVGDWSFKADLP